MLPPYYKLGRNAASGAIDAHAGMQVDLRWYEIVSAAYKIASEMEAESEGGLQNLPDGIHLLAPNDYMQYVSGYEDALTEAGR